MNQDAIRPLDLGSVDHVLNTTRSVRQRLDFGRPVPMSLIREALEIALQAPTGANTQTWRFMVVTDAAKRQQLADFYRQGAAAYVEGRTALSKTGVTMMREYAPEDLRQQQRAALMKSGGYLMEHLQRAPVMDPAATACRRASGVIVPSMTPQRNPAARKSALTVSACRMLVQNAMAGAPGQSLR